MANNEDEKIIALLFEASRSMDDLTAVTIWPQLYVEGVLHRLLKHWNLPMIELRDDGRYQLTEFGCHFQEDRMRFGGSDE